MREIHIPDSISAESSKESSQGRQVTFPPTRHSLQSGRPHEHVFPVGAFIPVALTVDDCSFATSLTSTASSLLSGDDSTEDKVSGRDDTSVLEDDDVEEAGAGGQASKD